MRFTRWRAAALAMTAAACALAPSQSNAVGGTYTTDDAGVDYDAACIVNTATTAPPPNSHTTNGCQGLSAYDGSTPMTDIGWPSEPNNPHPLIWCGTAWVPADLCLYSADGSLMVRQAHSKTSLADLNLPAPGDLIPTTDLMSSDFNGATYYSMIQNKSVQTNVPTNASGGGCVRVGTGTPVYDMHGSWKDGYHFFDALSVEYVGGRWVHTVMVGEYHPGPDGGFMWHELGSNDGSGWVNANPYMTKGTHWDVEITSNSSGTLIHIWFDGIVKIPDPTCANGYFTYVVARPNDVMANAKAMTTGNRTVSLPVAVPTSVLCLVPGGMCEDVTAIGGFQLVSDVTDGTSTPGLFNRNIAGVSYTPGLFAHLDTLGPTSSCPTPTMGGLLPTNPLFTPDTACHVDDDAVSRGSFLGEFWDTTHGFVF